MQTRQLSMRKDLQTRQFRLLLLDRRMMGLKLLQ